MAQQQVLFMEAGGRNTASLAQISGIQALFDVDATLSASYAGSGQTWSNVVAAPADSSLQTAYDFFLGATNAVTTDDPTFTGSAGSAAAYFALDGGDLFQIAAGNTTALNKLHMTTGGQPATILLAFQPGSSNPINFFGTTKSSTGTGVFSGFATAGTHMFINQVTATTGHIVNLTTAALGLSDQVLAVGFDYTGGTLKHALNARAFTTDAISSAATTTAASTAFQIGAAGGAGNMPAGSRIYGCYAFNKLLSDADLSAVIDVLNSRHGRTYA